MFDHSGWGKNLEAKTVDWRGWEPGREKEAFLKPLLKHWECCHAELMGLLT